jgi:LAO/AO transport system kinase
MEATGEFAARRRRQSLNWMWALIESGLRRSFRDNPAVKRTLPQLAHAVELGEASPAAAARRLLGLHGGGSEIP